MADGKAVSTLELRSEVLGRTYADGEVTLHVRVGQRQLDQLRSAGAQLRVQVVPGVARATPGEKRKAKASPSANKATTKSPKPTPRTRAKQR
jgi:hypothetical protein